MEAMQLRYYHMVWGLEELIFSVHMNLKFFSGKSCPVGILLFCSGADLGFSRGGGRIFKKFSKILTTFFFRSIRLIFRALPKQ